MAARLAVAAVIAAALPLVVPGAASAATVTCTGPAHVFDVRSNGDLWLYDHTSPDAGAYTWANIHQIGSGFTGTVFAGAGGDIYRITSDGVLHLYNYANGNWVDTSGTAIGAGWQAFAPGMITVDSAGRIYAVKQQNGALYMFHYDKATGAWDDPGGTPMDLGWNHYVRIAAAGDNVLYAVDGSGTLFRYRYDTHSQRWTEYGRQVGTGFAGSIFSPGGDVLYLTAGGLTYWYHFNDDTGTWDSDTGRLVAQGFDSTHQVSAGTDACAVPAPAPVPNVTPEQAPADAPIAVADGDPGGQDANGELILFYPDQSGHVMAAFTGVNSLTGQSEQLSSAIVTTAPMSAQSEQTPNRAPYLAVLDTTGQVWLSGGNANLDVFTPLGGYMKAMRLVPSLDIDLVGEDSSGALWERQTFDTITPKLMPWRPVGVTLTPGTPSTDLPDLGLVSAADNAYGVGNTANGDAQVLLGSPSAPTPWTSTSMPVGNVNVLGVGDEVQTLPTLVGYDSTAGQASVRTISQQPDTWHPLPPLALADHKPVSVYGEFSTFNAIAALGADGLVHVTNNYSSQGDTYLPWQQLSTQAAATPPTLLGDFDDRVIVVFRGTDGQLYRFTAPPNTAKTALSFTGGALRLSP